MIILNNHPTPTSDWLIGNRGLRYGDGLFETILWHNGKAPLLEAHLQRLAQSAAYLGLELPSYLTAKNIEQQAQLLVGQNNITNNIARLRLTVYRTGSGAYLPDSNQTAVMLECLPLDASVLQLNEQGLKVGLYKENTKAPGPLANLKTLNSLLYILASQYAQQQAWDDALLLNTHGKVIEATASNLFLVKGTNLHTPPLKEGPLDGVARKTILRLAMEAGFGVSSGPVEPAMLLDADELLLTNAIKGVQWVSQYGSKTYGNKVAGQLHQLWLDTIK